MTAAVCVLCCFGVKGNRGRNKRLCGRQCRNKGKQNNPSLSERMALREGGTRNQLGRSFSEGIFLSLILELHLCVTAKEVRNCKCKKRKSMELCPSFWPYSPSIITTKYSANAWHTALSLPMSQLPVQSLKGHHFEIALNFSPALLPLLQSKSVCLSAIIISLLSIPSDRIDYVLLNVASVSTNEIINKLPIVQLKLILMKSLAQSHSTIQTQNWF